MIIVLQPKVFSRRGVPGCECRLLHPFPKLVAIQNARCCFACRSQSGTALLYVYVYVYACVYVVVYVQTQHT